MSEPAGPTTVVEIESSETPLPGRPASALQRWCSNCLALHSTKLIHKVLCKANTLDSAEMTWVSEKKLSWYESICMNILKAGNVPKHIAFIMDGNRRFAERNHMQKVEGHSRGFSKLAETLKWCRDLGANEVTVYAFSIENFRRPKEEVDGIMNLAREKFNVLLDEIDKLMEHGVCVRFIGDLTLLPLDIQRQIADITLLTRHNASARLNVAFSYTAREEISRAVRDVAVGVEDGLLKPNDVTEQLIELCLYTRDSPHPDLLVRTSGEVRLSDFLLWQTTHTCLFFTEVLWPDFSIWHLFIAVFRYQRSYQHIQDARACADTSISRLQHSVDAAGGPPAAAVSPSHQLSCTGDDSKVRADAFLSRLDRQRWRYFEQLRSTTPSS